MLDVDIHYRPVRFLPWERHKKIMLPTKWDELTEKQFIFVPDLQRGILSESKILQVFLYVNRGFVKKMDFSQKDYILSHLTFLKKPEPFEYFKIKELSILKAPKPQLEDV